MSVDESRGSTPSVDPSDSPSPVPSSSQTPTHHAYANGYHNGTTDFTRFSSPGPQSNLPSHVQMHRVQGGSHIGRNISPYPIDDHQFIKRPLNAYMIWTVQERKRILAKDPKMKMNDVSRLMGEKWKTLSDKEKRPYFEMSKQNKLEHKRVLKDNPNLVYHPQRKKPLKGAVKQEPYPPMDVSPGTPMSNGCGTPILTATSQTRLNGCANVCYQTQSASQGGTILVAQALGVRSSNQTSSGSQATPISFTYQAQPVQQQSVQRNNQQAYQTTNTANTVQSGPANMHQMLDMYYTSLCQPAFPEPGETNNMAPPQYYLDQYQQLQYQAMASQQYGHQGYANSHSSSYHVM